MKLICLFSFLSLLLFTSCGFQVETFPVLDDSSKFDGSVQNLGEITVLQSISKGYDSGGSVTTAPINTQISTNFIVFIMRENYANPTALSDNKGNTFTQVLASTVGNGGTWDDGAFAFTCFDCTGGSNHIFAAGTAAGYPSIFVIEISSTSSLKLGLTSSSTTVQSSSPVESGPLNAKANSLLVGFATSGEQGIDGVYTWNNGFVKQTEITDISYWPGSTAVKKVTSDSVNRASMDTTEIDDGTALLLELTL